jgi:GT2 family glycosyltransferase/glycosyltransferase involved in cell wall biosynthesis
VVVNWNSYWLTARCLRSLRASTYPAEALEIVVVDNCSIDGSLARLQEEFPEVRFVENETNLGFAEGNNRALQDLGSAEFVALINNDAVVTPEWCEPLVDCLVANPTVGAAAPKMLLEYRYIDIETSAGNAELTAVRVNGFDVTGRCLFFGAGERPHETIPLSFRRFLRSGTIISVPVPPSSPASQAHAGNSPFSQPAGDHTSHLVEIEYSEATETPVCAVSRTDSEPATSSATNLHAPGSDSESVARNGALQINVSQHQSTPRLNSMGIELTPWNEGVERWFGTVDRPAVPNHQVWGFCGGAALLRAAALAECGLFNPRYFAYYEDTDLSWRFAEKGWLTYAVPESEVIHLHGGSAGPTARGFFFLNYRNWLLTALQHGTPAQILRTVRVGFGLAGKPFRRNVVGLLRRGRRPNLTHTRAWALVGLGVLGEFSRLVTPGGRAARTGRTPTLHPRPGLMPHTPPRSPQPRLGGPTIIYVDVTETLRSGWRAGIQRVTSRLVAELPHAAPDFDIVPLVWNPLHDWFRQVDAGEHQRLLAPTGTSQPAAQRIAPPRPLAVRVALRAAKAGWQRAPRSAHQQLLAARTWRARHNEPQHHQALAIDPVPGPSVFFDVDASWNTTTAERATLLPRLVANGVRTVCFLHDLIPQRHPEWFIPQLVSVSTEHLHAHLDAGSWFICNSASTLEDLRSYCEEHDRAQPAGTVVPLGADALAQTGTADRSSSGVRRTLLVVGTVEPRKNHAVVLAAFERLSEEFPDVDLVVVGRPGWRNDEVLNQLRGPSQRVRWIDNATDEQLSELYEMAFLVVTPSITEGYGLPVIEALQHGCVVISSNGGALPEAGGEFVEYFNPSDAAGLGELLRRHLTDAPYHLGWQSRVATFSPPNWRDTAVHVAQILRRRATTPIATHDTVATDAYTDTDTATSDLAASAPPLTTPEGARPSPGSSSPSSPSIPRT